MTKGLARKGQVCFLLCQYASMAFLARPYISPPQHLSDKSQVHSVFMMRLTLPSDQRNQQQELVAGRYHKMCAVLSSKYTLSLTRKASTLSDV